MSTLYDYKFNDIGGKEVSLKSFKGYVILIVNTASECGLTPQFDGLEKLYEKYKQKKFAVIGFPCNQFQNQDPGSNQDIQEFCRTTYGVSFLMAEKIDVNGPNAHPLYDFLKAKAPGLFGSKSIKWNFTKFLIDRKGEVKKRFAPHLKPSKISSYIEKLI
jgi:glutathione peroxidase